MPRIKKIQAISYQKYNKLSPKEAKSFVGLVVDNSCAVYIVNGSCHREDGPAEIYFEGFYTKRYFSKSKLHRIDGPANCFRSSHNEYFFNGQIMTKEQHEFYVDLLKLKSLL